MRNFLTKPLRKNSYKIFQTDFLFETNRKFFKVYYSELIANEKSNFLTFNGFSRFLRQHKARKFLAAVDSCCSTEKDGESRVHADETPTQKNTHA